MGTPFLGEIRIMSFSIIPKNWAQCNGQLLPINQNQALFSLLGTNYGGNGQTTFGLPDLRSRVPIGFGAGIILGERAGSENVTVDATSMPAHTHTLNAGSLDPSLNTTSPSSALLSRTADNAQLYNTGSADVAMLSTVSLAGGGQPHENRQPFLALQFCISLVGIFPSQS